MNRSVAMLLLVASMSLTGANVPLAKLLLAELPAETLLLARFAIASGALALLVRTEPGPPLASLEPRQWRSVLILALVGSVLFTVAILAGVQRTSAASAGIITATLPAVVALIGIGLGHRSSPSQLAMIALAVTGVGLVQLQPVSSAVTSGANEIWIGNAMIGAAVLCEATFVIVARGISAELRPIRLSLAVALVSLAICMPFGVVPTMQLGPVQFPPAAWALFSWYALTSSVACTVLWYRGAAHVEPWATGLATAAVPVAALAVSHLVLGEPISATQIGGALLVVAAILVGTLAQRSE